MSITRHHAEWLSLIEISGPFLSLPVLSEVFPQGLHAHDAEHSKLLRRAFEEWDDNQDSDKPDPAIHREWIKWVLNNTLEFADDLIEGQEIPQALKAEVAEHGETLRPDWVLAEPKTKKPRLLVKMYPRSQALTKPVSGSRWKASPDTRMAELLRNCGAESRLGLVTNGDQWMMVHAPQGETTGYASWYSNLWFEEPLTQRAFRTLLSLERFFGVPDEETLEALLKRSFEDQQQVTIQLGYQVRRAVEVLIQSLDKADRDYKGKLLKDISEARLYEAALTVMMRLVFLFCAEERELLLLGDDLYDGNYAVSTLREQLQEAADEHGEEILSLRYDAWSRLLTTFRAVYGGVQHQGFKLPAYGGHLFDPDRFPFLEGRKSDTKWKETAAQPLPVNNQTVLHLLKSLQLLEVKMPGRKGTIETQKLSFRALGIEQIGHVYEGLLDHTAVRATEPVLGLTGGKDKEPEVTLSKLEGLLAKGADKLADVLKKETGRSAQALTNALSAEINDELHSRFRTACQGDEELWERVEPLAGLVRIDTFGYPVVIPAGSVYVTAGTDRRSSGTHYTPRSLTEPIVQYTLEPLVYEGPAEGTPKDKWKLKSPKELLDLKICDMACGSGAFLVQAARYMAERLLEAWEVVEQDAPGAVKITPFGEPSTGEADEQLIPDDPDERIVYARRIVAQRCLYGVDINPLAVEMAKLSLWLLTLAKDKPFTFLDHCIRCGDSLVGISSIEQLERFSLNGGGPQKSFAHEQIRRRIDAARLLRLQLERMPTNTVSDIERKTEMLKRAEEQTGRLRYAADMMLAVHWRGMTETEREQELQDTLLDVEFKFKDLPVADLTAEAEKRLASVGCQRTFHWPLEFPEAFGLGGIDAVVGNPPFIGGTLISGRLGKPYLQFIKATYAHDSDSGGRADLCSYFFLRSHSHLRREGCFGLLGTNTIAQGDSREVGLHPIVESGSCLFRANSSRKWPGVANLEVAEIWGRRGDWSGNLTLDGELVSRISSFLSSMDTMLGPPKHLKANEGLSCEGSKPLGMGFVLEPEEAAELISHSARNRDVILPYLNGKDLNSRPDQSPSRFVITFFDWPLDHASADANYIGPVAADYPECLKVVEEKVKPERTRKKASGEFVLRKPLPQRWWQHAEKRTALYVKLESLKQTLIRSRVSNLNSIAMVPTGTVFSEATVVFASDDLAFFAALQSAFHTEWIVEYASTMRTDLRYTPSDCFDTFPFPESSERSRTAGQNYREHRKQVMRECDEGLTKTYNRFHDTSDASSDIQLLRRLHVEMDQAVAAAYGWGDIELGHDFHETKQGVRYTISEPARREVLQRLLKLNHERYEEEVKQGLHDKKKKAKKKAAPKKKTAKVTPKQAVRTLFDMDAVESAFGTKDSEKFLCGLLLDVVAADPQQRPSTYLDALVIVLRHEHHSKLLVGKENKAFAKLCKKIPKAWIQEVSQIPWSELKDLLTLQEAIVVQGQEVSVGDAFTKVRKSYPAIDAELIDLLVKASGELRALKASTKALSSEAADELATFEQDSASLCGEIA